MNGKTSVFKCLNYILRLTKHFGLYQKGKMIKIKNRPRYRTFPRV